MTSFINKTRKGNDEDGYITNMIARDIWKEFNCIKHPSKQLMKAMFNQNRNINSLRHKGLKTVLSAYSFTAISMALD